MKMHEDIAKLIQLRFADQEIRKGGVYHVAEEVNPICHQLISILQTLGVPAIVGWEDGLAKQGGYMSDVTVEMMRVGIERDYRLTQGGVAVVELKHSDFGLTNLATLKELVTVETDREPKRMVTFLTESAWIAGVLGNITEDMRKETL